MSTGLTDSLVLSPTQNRPVGGATKATVIEVDYVLFFHIYFRYYKYSP